MDIIKDIENLIKERTIFEVGDQKFSFNELKPVIDKTTVATLQVNSLQGFVDYALSNPDDLQPGLLITHIENETSVVLTEPFDHTTKIRQRYVIAKHKDDTFPFCSFMDHEKFMIKLQSMFESTDDLTKLLRYTSRLTSDNSVIVEDDGITQTATVKKGISGAIKEAEKSPAIVNLKPYRTFREIDQPVSTFLFRISSKNSGYPECALYEADGSSWKNIAMQSIKQYLRNNIGMDAIILS